MSLSAPLNEGSKIYKAVVIVFAFAANRDRAHVQVCIHAAFWLVAPKVLMHDCTRRLNHLVELI